MPNTDIIRTLMKAYQEQDRSIAERLLANEFRFTSPQDDHIDRSAYLERCFPTADRFVQQRIVELAEVSAEGVFLLYEYELATGGRYRNAEFITIRGGQLVETQVFFGGAA